MDLKLYTDVYQEWLWMMGYFGRIISLAFSDISGKANKLKANSNLINGFLEDQGKSIKTVEDFISFELENNLAFLNGSSWKSNLKQAKQSGASTEYLKKHSSKLSSY